MRTLAILFAISSICYGFDMRCMDKHLLTVINECTIENGGNEHFLANWLNLQNSTSENEKCFRGCVMAKCAFFDNNGMVGAFSPTALGLISSNGDATKAAKIEVAGQLCRRIMTYTNNVCQNSENWTKCLATHCYDCEFTVSHFQ
ncbi:uncharacterized protein [Musca autumnalis]|uniref:uncharacterized protein n=1 Tax=Musca autumnalis TaxID=221902 RepID=UPI003CF91BF9